MRWLFWATVINYLDRQTLSAAAPTLREQFHLSNVDYSRIIFACVDHYSYAPVFIGFGLMPLLCAGILWGFLGPLRATR